jgi:hypothetical protein
VARSFVKGFEISVLYNTESVEIFFSCVTPHKYCSTLKMEAECSFETLALLYIKWHWVTFWGESSGHGYRYSVAVSINSITGRQK